ncbi:unnamed protein product [Urochloa decumbens]|uniref:alpha-amylase n=1 Tax=Urochloa decumbens TaxID=240449 RepID=A0ABC9CXC0_9POAL
MEQHCSRATNDQDPHRQALVDWVNKVGGAASPATVFDFTTKGILNAAVEGELWRLVDAQGKAPGVILDGGRPRLSLLRPFLLDWGFKDEIAALVAVRKRNGIMPTSELRILEHDGDAYVAEIDGKVVVKIGSRFDDVGHLIPAGFEVAAHRNDYAVWEKA